MLDEPRGEPRRDPYGDAVAVAELREAIEHAQRLEQDALRTLARARLAMAEGRRLLAAISGEAASLAGIAPAARHADLPG